MAERRKFCGNCRKLKPLSDGWRIAEKDGWPIHLIVCPECAEELTKQGALIVTYNWATARDNRAKEPLPDATKSKSGRERRATNVSIPRKPETQADSHRQHSRAGACAVGR